MFGPMHISGLYYKSQFDRNLQCWHRNFYATNNGVTAYDDCLVNYHTGGVYNTAIYNAFVVISTSYILWQATVIMRCDVVICYCSQQLSSSDVVLRCCVEAFGLGHAFSVKQGHFSVFVSPLADPCRIERKTFKLTIIGCIHFIK